MKLHLLLGYSSRGSSRSCTWSLSPTVNTCWSVWAASSGSAHADLWYHEELRTLALANSIGQLKHADTRYTSLMNIHLLLHWILKTCCDSTPVTHLQMSYYCWFYTRLSHKLFFFSFCIHCSQCTTAFDAFALLNWRSEERENSLLSSSVCRSYSVAGCLISLPTPHIQVQLN